MSSKLTALTEVSVPVLSDISYTVADPGGTPASDKITWKRVGGLLNPLYTTGRLTLVSGNAAPNTDQSAKGTLYYTSVTNDGTVTSNHFQIVIYDGTRLQEYDSAEISLALTLTSANVYDVFIYDNAGTLTLELSAAWTSNARNDALAAQSGTVVKSGTTTRRWIGTIYATGTNQTTDALATRCVWNAYNQLPRYAYIEDTNSHTYNGAERNYDNSGTATLIQYVHGKAEEITWVFCAYMSDTNSETMNGVVRLRIDGGANEPQQIQEFLTGGAQNANMAGYTLCRQTGIGYHSGIMRENGATGTITFGFGSNSAQIDN